MQHTFHLFCLKQDHLASSFYGLVLPPDCSQSRRHENKACIYHLMDRGNRNADYSPRCQHLKEY